MARDLLQRQPGLYAQGYYSLAYGVPLADTAAACVIPASASLAFGVWQYAKRSGRLKNIADLFKSKDHLRFYIQGDEVVHEQYHAAIKAGCEQYQDDQRAEGLLFKYLHFYGTYDYVGDSRTWYRNEVRVIRNDRNIKAYKDAQGFRKGLQKLKVKAIDAYVYHYGWVKSPAQMMKKQKEFSKLWHNDEALSAYMAQPDFFDYSQFDSLEKFKGTHPNVMQKRIEQANWPISFDPAKKKFSLKDKVLYYFEKATGIRPFDFKNYRLIR